LWKGSRRLAAERTARISPAGSSLGLPDSLGAGSLRGVVPEQQAEVDTWVVMEYCNRGTLQVGPQMSHVHTRDRGF
jgi:hypothetical protein